MHTPKDLYNTYNYSALITTLILPSDLNRVKVNLTAILNVSQEVWVEDITEIWNNYF